MRLTVPVGALGLVEARCCQPVQRIVPQQQVPGQRVPSVNVQAPVGVPHWVPVEGGVGEPVSSWDRADTHEGRHHSSSLQAADAVDGVDTRHAHGHRHGGGGMEVWRVAWRGCLCWVLILPLCGSVLILLPLLLHFHLIVFLLVLVRQLYLLLQDLSAQPAVRTFQAGLPHVGWCRPPVGHLVLWHSAVMDDGCVLVAVLVVFELMFICAIVFPGVCVLPLPVFGLVLLVPLRLSRGRGQVVPVVLWRSAVAKEADGVDGDWGWMAWMTLFYRISGRKKEGSPFISTRN